MEKKKGLFEAVQEYIKDKKKPAKSQAAPLGGGTKKMMKNNKAYQESVLALGEE
jgi:hypothetical protein